MRQEFTIHVCISLPLSSWFAEEMKAGWLTSLDVWHAVNEESGPEFVKIVQADDSLVSMRVTLDCDLGATFPLPLSQVFALVEDTWPTIWPRIQLLKAIAAKNGIVIHRDRQEKGGDIEVSFEIDQFGAISGSQYFISPEFEWDIRIPNSENYKELEMALQAGLEPQQQSE